MQDIRVLDTGLDITPVADKSRTHFNLHNLKNVLPNIVVNVIFVNPLSLTYITKFYKKISNVFLFSTNSLSPTERVHFC